MKHSEKLTSSYRLQCLVLLLNDAFTDCRIDLIFVACLTHNYAIFRKENI